MKYSLLTLLAVTILFVSVSTTYAQSNDIDTEDDVWMAIHTNENRYLFSDLYTITLNSLGDSVEIKLNSFDFDQSLDDLYIDVRYLDHLAGLSIFNTKDTRGFSQILFENCTITNVTYYDIYEMYYELKIKLSC